MSFSLARYLTPLWATQYLVKCSICRLYIVYGIMYNDHRSYTTSTAAFVPSPDAPLLGGTLRYSQDSAGDFRPPDWLTFPPTSEDL